MDLNDRVISHFLQGAQIQLAKESSRGPPGVHSHGRDCGAWTSTDLPLFCPNSGALQQK